MPGEVVELTKENTIPRQALRQTLDKTNEMLKSWKQDATMRNTTFPSSQRFKDPKVPYGSRAANFSLLDIENYFKDHNGAPQIDKFSDRPGFLNDKKVLTEEE